MYMVQYVCGVQYMEGWSVECVCGAAWGCCAKGLWYGVGCAGIMHGGALDGSWPLPFLPLFAKLMP